jgi:hypothetical protein
MPTAAGQVKIRHKAVRSSLFIPFFTCPSSDVTVYRQVKPRKANVRFSQLFDNLNC